MLNFHLKKMDLITSTREMSEYVKNKYPDLKMQQIEDLCMHIYLHYHNLLNVKKKYPKEEKRNDGLYQNSWE